MKKWILILCLFAGSLFQGYAQNDHLEPASMDFYKKLYAKLFLKSQGKEVSYLKFPAWGNLCGFTLENEEKRILVSLTCDQRCKKILTNRIEISEDLYQSIKLLFDLALQQVDYPEGEIMDGLDGITYYFSIVDSQKQFIEGEIWTPGDSTLMKRLVMICDRISDIPSKECNEPELLKDIESLQEKIQEYDVCWRRHKRTDRFTKIKDLGNIDELPYMQGTTPAEYILKHLTFPKVMLDENIFYMVDCHVNINKHGVVHFEGVGGVRPKIGPLPPDLKCLEEDMGLIVKGMPQWIPAKSNGIPVETWFWFTVPLNPLVYKMNLMNN